MTFRSKIAPRLLFLPVFWAFAGGLQAQVCTNSTTVGRYIYMCEGYISLTGSASSLLPARQLGTVTGDDNGTFRGTGTTNVGGLAMTGTVEGTQKLNKDCTGTISYTQSINGQPGPPLNITYVVSEQGNRIDGLPTDQGQVLACVLRRISNDEPVTTSASTVKKEGDKLASRATTKSSVAR